MTHIYSDFLLKLCMTFPYINLFLGEMSWNDGSEKGRRDGEDMMRHTLSLHPTVSSPFPLLTLLLQL